MNHLKTHKNFINESHNSYYIETHVDGQQKLGSDWSVVLLEDFPSERVLQHKVDQHIKNLRSLKTNVHKSLNTAKSIVLKLSDRQHKVYKEIDVTADVQK